LVLASSAPAGAAVNCAYKGSAHRLEVGLTKGGDIAVALVDVGTIEIRRNSVAGALVNCSGAAATTTNTDRITVEDQTARASTQFSISDPDDFEPGFTNEPGVNEIELRLDLGKGREDELSGHGAGVADSLVLGSDGINLNAGVGGESAVPDADLTEKGVEDYRFNLGGGLNELSGQGGSGTGEEFPRGLSAFGGAEVDTFSGGDGADALVGSGGADDLAGFAGRDLLSGGGDDDDLAGGLGDDFLTGGLDSDQLTGDPILVPAGGAGEDTVSYSERDLASDEAVSADLDGAAGGNGSSDDGTVGNRDTIVRVDNLIGTGSSSADFLQGNGSDNKFDGGAGPDQMIGGDGDDTLDYSNRSEEITVLLGPPFGQGGASDGGGDAIAQIEGFIGGSGDDELSVDPSGTFAVTFDGRGGNDALTGSPFDDLLIGGRGRDRLFGLGGIDFLNAKDRRRDRKIDCGDGANSQEKAKFDQGLDPAPISC
jgi:Ca2+-binding RTX toxin-like protein